VVADLGCGTGALTAAIAPHVARVIGIDQSAAMLKAARARTAVHRNVELRRATLADLPIEDATCDAALLVLALSYVPDPAPVLLEMARILKPGGRAVIMDVLRHDREDFQRAMGQAVPGFEGEKLAEKVSAAGFFEVTWRPLPPEAGAKGPALLLATGHRARRPRPVSLDSRRTR
jgi:ArsR family transcriptional regulator